MNKGRINRHLAFSYLKKQPQKSISLILSIVICCTLITTVGIIFSSLGSNMNEFTKRVNGEYFYRINNLSMEDAKNISKESEITSSGIRNDIGKRMIEDRGEMNLSYLDDGSMELLSMKLIEGEKPLDEYDIMIDESLQYAFDEPLKVGDIIKVDISNGSKKKGLHITGIFKTYPGSQDAKEYLGIISREMVDEIGEIAENFSVYINFKKGYSINDVFKASRDIENKYGIDNEQMEGNPNTINMIQQGNVMSIPGLLLGLIVIIAAVLVIYNIFNISVLDRIKDYGIYRCLGLRPKKIRKMILIEAFILSIIAIPLGLLFGMIIGNLIYASIATFTNIEVKELDYPVYILIVAAVVSFISVIISTLIPARKAAKVSPLEAVRNQTGEESKGGKDKKWHKKMKDILGTSRYMAYKNLWRNKRRTYITILSLSFSTILLIVFTYYFSNFRMLNPTEVFKGGEYKITIKEDELQGTIIRESDVVSMKSIEGAENVAPTSMSYSKILLHGEEEGVRTYINGYSTDMMERLNDNIIHGELNLKDFKGGGVIINKTDFMEGYSIKVGDLLKFRRSYKKDNSEKYLEEYVELKVMCIIEGMPYGIKKSGKGIPVIMEQSKLNEFSGKDGYDQVEIKVSGDIDRRDFERKLKSSISTGMEIKSFYELSKELEKVKSLMKILMYSFIGFIVFICTINIMNTMSTSVLTRKNEFAVLRALGFNKKHIGEIIFFEGIFYGVISSIIGIGISMGICRLLYITLDDMGNGSQIIIIILAVFINISISVFAGIKPLKKIQKSNIVESIKSL